jgi:hypothetical protein
MPRIIIILIILVSFISSSRAQTAFDLELLSLERNVYQSNSDTEKAVLILKKLDFYLNKNVTSKAAFNEAQRINYNFLSGERQKRFLWNASLLAHLNDDRDYARFYLNRYEEISADTSAECLLLQVLINNGQDSALLVQDTKRLAAFNSEFKCLTCLNDLAYYHKGKRNVYLVASALLPGLGSTLEGYPLKGITSTLVNAASAFAIYELVRSNLYINAALWGITFITKFYVGNIRLTERLFYQKEGKEKNILAGNCEDKIKNLLKKYPLAFK